MKKLVVLLYLVVTGFVHVAADNDIIAVVDKDIITRTDLDNRVKAAIASNQNLAQEDENAVRVQVVQSMVNEKIFVQEADRLGIQPTQDEINNAVRHIEASQSIPHGELFKRLESQGVSKGALMNQITTNIIWNKLLLEVIAPGIEVSNEELLAFISHNKPEKVHVDAYLVTAPVAYQKQLEKVFNRSKKGCAALVRSMPDKSTSIDFTHITSNLSEVSDLKLRKMIADLHKDQLSSIYEDGDKLSFIGVCTKKYDMDTKEMAEFDNVLREKKVVVQAEYYMQNLKKKKYIEIYDLNG